MDNVEGVVVGKVLTDSPAEIAGMEMGDVILEMDGQKVKTSNELQSKLVFKKVGDEVKLKIWRDGKEMNKTLKLKARPDEKDEMAAKGGSDEENDNQNKTEKDQSVKFDELGFSIEPLKKETKETLEVESGVSIKEVDRYGVAAERGLFVGGVITKVDKQAISTCDQLKKYLKSKNPGDAVRLYVKYKDSSRIVAIELPDHKSTK